MRAAATLWAVVSIQNQSDFTTVEPVWSLCGTSAGCGYCCGDNNQVALGKRKAQIVQLTVNAALKMLGCVCSKTYVVDPGNEEHRMYQCVQLEPFIHEYRPQSCISWAGKQPRGVISWESARTPSQSICRLWLSKVSRFPDAPVFQLISCAFFMERLKLSIPWPCVISTQVP